MILAGVLAVGAALCFAVCSVVQHRETGYVEQTGVRLFMRLLQRPWFLVAVLIELLGLVLQSLALGVGALVLVQPLLVTGLLFAVPLSAAVDKRAVAGVEWWGALATVVGLAVFLTTGSPSKGGYTYSLSRACAVGIPLIALATVATVWAQLWRAARGILLGLASGVLYGTSGGLLKVVVHRLGDDGLGGLVHWETVVLVVMGAASVVTTQSAFQAGGLGAPLAVLTLAEPLAAVLVGSTVLHERLASSVTDVVLEAIGGLVAAAGVVLLSSSPSARLRVATP
ncbi:MAG TPA: DMT family transporter [Mycobacteriales bacterium]|nr:DMT family transporter [Mycobacteriales bacterium]